MKNFILLKSILVTILILMCTTSQSKIWRLNNTPGVDADFTTFSAAHSAASTGDTIYVEGNNSVSYGNWTITKRLIIIGPGYHLSSNDSTQANPYNAIVEGIVFSTGSSNSVISGLLIYNGSPTYSYACITISANNITVRNCYTNQTGGNSYVNINVASGILNTTIEQNYLYQGAYGIYFNGSHDNTIIQNNIFLMTQGYFAINMPNSTVDAICYNNIIISGRVAIHNTVYRNNIHYYQTSGNEFTASGTCTITNNLCNGGWYGTANGNQQNVNMDNVFMCWTSCGSYTFDERYRLKSGSPALNAGFGGVDCGVFDGPTPYAISGIYRVPAIWYFQSQGTQITIKVKSH